MGSYKEPWASEPIAIIGLSCKFAGDARNPEQLWEMLSEGRSAWSEIPSSRFNPKGTHHPNSEKINTTNAKGAHFIEEDVGLFDAAFFNFSAETASAIDPQFRLQLESTYEALENAGLPLAQVAGSSTSVFTGVFSHDYHEGIMRDEDQLPRFLPIGTFSAMSSNRISHFFDLRGASMTVDTGCSTTLVALHQAVASLRTREADMSIVSGSNLLLTPDMFKVFGSLGMLSPDGKSYAFDSRANGYGRGEGVATIVIKRLDDALACGDPIRALIRETCLNQDGKTETITTPSQSAQEDLMHECYRRAGLDPQGTQYFEAHGTGTPTGDPIEARAITAVFGGPDRKEPLRIGSLKTNVGHTEAASGLASLVKVVLALEKGQIPPSINFKTPNPKLCLDEWRLKVPTSLEEWSTLDPHQPRRASVNNFGYGGSNAHVIVEGFDGKSRPQALSSRPSMNGISTGEHEVANSTLLVLSARDEGACRRMVTDLQEYLKTRDGQGTAENSTLMRNLSYTLGERRTLFPWVAANVVRFQDGKLEDVIQALGDPLKFTPHRVPSRTPRIGMVFTGQGAQWHAMGRELIDMYPVFRSALDEAGRHLKGFGADWSLIEELGRDAKTTRVNTTALSIPICVALQIALVRLLESWSITPTAVTSHSSGEIAAAYAAGALTLRQAMAAAYYRATLAADPALRSSGEAGGMLAVGVGDGEGQRYVDRVAKAGAGKAVVACINSPQSVTIAGDVGAVDEIEELCKQDGVFARRLRVDTAYHSHHMEPIAEAYRSFLRTYLQDEAEEDFGELDEDNATRVAFSSAVTGGRITSNRQIASPEHWIGSLLQPVKFTEAFTDMVLGDDGATADQAGDVKNSSSVDVLLEVGPHTALGAPIREILSLPEFEGLEIPYWGCLVRKEHAGDTLRSAAINFLREGMQLDMQNINNVSTPKDAGVEPLRVLTDLPSYPWNHSNKHWQESRINRSIRARDQQPHDLLGSLVSGTNIDNATWRNIVRVSDSSWLRDHVVQDNVVYPAAGYICLAIEATKQLARIQNQNAADPDIAGYRVQNVELQAALVVPESAQGIEIQTSLRQVSDRNLDARGWKEFEIHSVTSDNRWTRHAKGLITFELAGTPETDAGLRLVNRPLSTYTRHIDPQEMFASLRSRGISHGPKFQNTNKIEQDGREPRCESHVTIADTSIPKDLDHQHVLHPTTLDSVILSSYGALPSAGTRDEDAKLPQSIQKLWVSSGVPRDAGHEFTCHTALSHSGSQNFQADSVVVDERTGKSVVEMQGLLCQSMGRTAGGNSKASTNAWENDLCSKIEWLPDLSLRQPRALAQIKQQLSRTANDVDSLRDIVLRLRRVCVYYCYDALQILTDQDISQLESHHVKFHGWMKDQVKLAASGGQGPGSEKWVSDTAEERKKQITVAEKESVEGEMVVRLGPLLVPMLRGERPPIEVMMEERLLYRYYAEAIHMAPSLTQLAALLRQVVHKNPRARILEIGAGTGGATRHMLKALGTPEDGGPHAGSWHFTDISSGFFEAARAEFAPWADILEFDRLDVEKDPAAQGFELGSYDIVVACEVLHATKSMARTFANVRSLMKPGATLLLMETTRDQVDMQLVFGLLPGWWLSEEPERQSSPSLSLPFCDRELKGAGFSGIELETRDCDSDDWYSISVIMSTALAQKQVGELTNGSLHSDEDTVVVVTSQRAPPPAPILKSIGVDIQKLTVGTPPKVVQLEDVGDNSSIYDGRVCVFLGEVSSPSLHQLDDSYFRAIKTMTTHCKGLLWVTAGGAVDGSDPNAALAHGLLRTLRNEYVGRRFISLDLTGPLTPDNWPPSISEAIAKVVEVSLLRSPSSDDDNAATDYEYAERDGVLLVPRMYKDTVRNRELQAAAWPATGPDWQSPDAVNFERGPLFRADGPTLKLEVGVPGLLDTLAFGPSDDEPPLGPDEVEIEPRAFGLNFRDVMVAMGQLRERVMGLECAGVVARVGDEARVRGGVKVGDRVMALLLGPSFASRMRVPWHGVAPMPHGMGFENAASLPMVFSTAYVGLVDAARLAPGQSVLIHAAAGGVGQAAVMLARHLGVGEIYVTVGSAEKRELMRSHYGIPESHIFNSRDASFAPAVLAATGGRGVDVVLNSLAGGLLQASFDILAPFGHLVELGKKDLEGNSLLAMGTFSRVASYSSLDMMTLLRKRGSETHRVLSEIARLAQDGSITPVQPTKAYPMGDVATAYRLLQTGKHMGKIVLSTQPDEEVNLLPSVGDVARTRTAGLKPDATYMLVGGVGGIGRSVARWLIDQGAKYMVLLSRSAGDLSKTGKIISELESAGCRVLGISCDVSNAGELSKARVECDKAGFPPIRGIIQGAMVLRDSVLEQMKYEDWQTCIAPKVYGTWNLHVQWAQQGSLDFFVMLSSFSGIIGIVSQANYAAGGAYQDAMAHWRQSLGLPGVSIDLGAVKGIGYVAETAGVAERMRKGGESVMIPEDIVLQAIQDAIVHGRTQPQILLGLNTGPGVQWQRDAQSQMSRDARYLGLKYRESRRQGDASGQAGDRGSEGQQTLGGLLTEAPSLETAAAVVGEAIAAKLSIIFMIPANEISLSQPPSFYGIDSLVAVELRNMLVLQAGAEVSIFTIMQTRSLAELAEHVAINSRYTTFTA